jgi:PglZ domain
MIDIWFKTDLQRIFDSHNIAVFIDESGQGEFMLRALDNDIVVHRSQSQLEELHVKYLIERQQPSTAKFLVYTRLKRDSLTFLREYCETNGCLEIRYLQNYVKEKVHQTLNLNINLPQDELIAAAKVSVGKDRTYWMDLSHKGSTEIFDLSKELLSFIHDPKSFSEQKYDAELRETFYRKVTDLLGQNYIPKPASTLATEVVTYMLDGLASNKCGRVSEDVYKGWLDSISYKSSFNRYLERYKLPENLDAWKVNINHPFRQVDDQWLAQVGSQISDKNRLPQLVTRIKQRNESKQAQALNITFWSDVLVLLEFDPKDISYLSSFAECVAYYTKHFWKLDTAIRNLYAEFLNKKPLLEPFQELYKNYVSIFLDKWFKYWDGYQESQTGALQKIIDATTDKIAVVVGDGVAYEIAEQVAAKISSSLKLTRDVIIADLPSETENNMSRIYMDNGVVEAVQGNRESYLLKKNATVGIDFLRLDEVSDEPTSGRVLICTYKDIDDIGEKLQQKALKYFPETIEFFAEKIQLLISSGYGKVYLVTDHGFVLTGLLSAADKISVTVAGEFDKAERYIRTKERQPGLTPGLLEIEKHYKQFKFLYAARNINPFKTPGLYGFSHGGACPQELVTPLFCWERAASPVAELMVAIEDKSALTNVTGDLFRVKIRSAKGSGNLFSTYRKVYLVFFVNKKQVNKSDVFSIGPDETIAKEYAFDNNSEIEIRLLDAQTKLQLDVATAKRNKDRDLGGLL